MSSGSCEPAAADTVRSLASQAARTQENKSAYEAPVTQPEVNYLAFNDVNWRIIFKRLRCSVQERDSRMTSTYEKWVIY